MPPTAPLASLHPWLNNSTAVLIVEETNFNMKISEDRSIFDKGLQIARCLFDDVKSDPLF